MPQSAAANAAARRPLADSWEETLERLRRYVAARVGDPEVAADITQDVVVRSIAAGALDRVDDPVAWLHRSASNAVIDHYRTRRRLDPLDEHDLGLVDDDTDEGPNDAIRDLAGCLRPLVERLEPIYRDAVVRVDLDGRTHRHVADELGVSVSGMKSRVQRGRRQLRDLLTACCAVDLDGTGAVSDYTRNPGCGCDTPNARSC